MTKYLRIIVSFANNIILLGIVLMLTQCSTQTQEKSAKDDCKEETCCSDESSTEQSEISEITCPNCGHTATENLPTEVCLIKYTCKKCNEELTPNDGDCCVFCTHGTHKCPSMQVE